MGEKSRETIQKNKLLFMKRFCYLSRNAELLYNILFTTPTKKETYEMLETIMFSNDSEQFDVVVQQLNDLREKMQKVSVGDSELNYTSSLLVNMFTTVAHSDVSKLLKQKKMNMIVQYNNFFTADSSYPLFVDPLIETDNYRSIPNNEFIDVMAHHHINMDDLEHYIAKVKKR